MNFQTNNFRISEPVRQPINFGYFGELGPSFSNLTPLMKFPKMGDYQGMMNMDFVPPTLETAHRINGMRPRPNRYMSEQAMNFDSQSINRNLYYDSGDSEEESKGLENKRDDELFLHPYSSMIRRKEASLLPSGYINEFKDINYDLTKQKAFIPQRFSDTLQQRGIDKPLLPHMPKY